MSDDFDSIPQRSAEEEAQLQVSEHLPEETGVSIFDKVTAFTVEDSGLVTDEEKVVRG